MVHNRQIPLATRPIRSGRINMLWMLVLGAAALIVVLVAALMQGGPQRAPRGKRVIMHTAAGIRFPVEEIAERYEKDYGIEIELRYGGSNSLLNQIQTNKFDNADLYLAADDYYTSLAVELGLAREVIPIAHQRPVVAVRKDADVTIASIEDLLQEDLVISMASPDQAAVGRSTQRSMEAIDMDGTTLWKKFEARVVADGVFKPTVTDVANDIKIGTADVGIVWDSTVAIPKYSEVLQAIPLPELGGDPNLIGVAVLNSSPNPTAALRFARYLAGRNTGLPVFESYGMRPVEGDVWDDELNGERWTGPEITFHCGAVNRRVVEDIVADFQEREGATVNAVYDGCGLLTSRMKTIEGQRIDLGFPDVYMACDVYYLENVKDWFQEAVNVSDVEIVIAVPKGSTKVQSLEDLLKPGIRVAIGEPDQCTIGALTRRMLQTEGLYERLLDKQEQSGEVVVLKSSSSLLVPDVVTGHVDAAIAYISDVLANESRVDIIRINSVHNQAIQPFSIAKNSEHKYLVRRLFQDIVSSPDAFADAGFHYRLDVPPADESGTP